MGLRGVKVGTGGKIVPDWLANNTSYEPNCTYTRPSERYYGDCTHSKDATSRGDSLPGHAMIVIRMGSSASTVQRRDRL